VPATVVVGAQWGDEGKGRVVDLLAEHADLVVRFQGGNNAGHTVLADGRTYHFHLLPCGLLRGIVSVIGNGVVVDPATLLEEVDTLAEQGHPVDGKLLLSENAHLIMPYHPLLDRLFEEAMGPEAIGTTLRGIGPAYADKYARLGIRVADLLNDGVFRRRVELNVRLKNGLLENVFHQPPLDTDAICAQYLGYRDRLRPWVTDTSLFVEQQLRAGKRVLFEGANGCMLDVDFGTYPYTTSSNTIAGAVLTGAGVSGWGFDRFLGVVKAYTTRVGQGPFPTEAPTDIAAHIRERGHEYGTTTGRPRRCGWFDAAVVRKAARLNQLTALAVTHLDVLDDFATIRVGTGYRAGGETLTEMPNSLYRLDGAKPVYEDLPGWRADTSAVRRWSDLPRNAQRYIERIETLTGVAVELVTVGASREQCLSRDA